MDDVVSDTTTTVAAQELRQFIERFERLEAVKKDIADAQKEVMAEAKGRGYDTKVLRKVIAIRKRDANDLAEEEAVLDMYKSALGMLFRAVLDKIHARQVFDKRHIVIIYLGQLFGHVVGHAGQINHFFDFVVDRIFVQERCDHAAFWALGLGRMGPQIVEEPVHALVGHDGC